MMIFVVVFFLVPAVGGHVSLIYPEAWWPPLDYLSNDLGTCGFKKPEGLDVITNFHVGKAYNISWRMAYVHEGGYRITLMNKYQNETKFLTGDADDFVGVDDETSHELVFDEVCPECILRIERQAKEFDMIFQSCATVNINSESETTDKCAVPDKKSFNFEHEPNMRQIEFCSYQGDCLSDEDCQGGGECVDLSQEPIPGLAGAGQTKSYPSRVCYCAGGRMGKNCEKESRVPENPDVCFNYKLRPVAEYQYSHGLFSPSCYQKMNMDGGDLLYFRKVNHGQDIEIVLDYNTTSWLAFGWKPQDLKNCQKFPIDFETGQIFAGVGYGAQSHDEGKGHGHEEPEPQSEPEPHSESQPEPHSEPEPELHSESEPEPHSEPEPSRGHQNNPHPMDCTDMVVASARGKLLKIGDFYTRDRSTPLPDWVYLGDDDIKAAFGKQTDEGRMVVMFRKPRKIKEGQVNDLADHLPAGVVQYIKAKGGQPGVVSYHRNLRAKGTVDLNSGALVPSQGGQILVLSLAVVGYLLK